MAVSLVSAAALVWVALHGSFTPIVAPEQGANVGGSRSALEPVAACPGYRDSLHYRHRERVVQADPTNWVQRIQDARDGDEVLLADGLYLLDRYSVVINRSITVRGESGDPDAVVIQGPGYSTGGEAFMVRTNDVTIAELTVRDVRNHAISVKGKDGADGVQIYNVHLLDIGTQHIKGTASTRGGEIRCSRIGYGPEGARGDYINGIDLHGAVEWSIADNLIYNIWGDGTGCEVDVDCGRYYAGGGPAILLWNGARDNRVERNRILDCFRGVAIGFGSLHPGGVVRNNFFFQSEPGRPGARGYIPGDAGIALDGATDTLVEHNTVILGGDYRGAIEVSSSAGVTIRNNLLSKPVWDRGGATFDAIGNMSGASPADLQGPGDPHLDPSSMAVDFPDAIASHDLPPDIDGQPRPAGAGPDAGCDESSRVFADGFESGALDPWS